MSTRYFSEEKKEWLCFSGYRCDICQKSVATKYELMIKIETNPHEFVFDLIDTKTPRYCSLSDLDFDYAGSDASQPSGETKEKFNNDHYSLEYIVRALNHIGHRKILVKTIYLRQIPPSLWKIFYCFILQRFDYDLLDIDLAEYSEKDLRFWQNVQIPKLAVSLFKNANFCFRSSEIKTLKLYNVLDPKFIDLHDMRMTKLTCEFHELSEEIIKKEREERCDHYESQIYGGQKTPGFLDPNKPLFGGTFSYLETLVIKNAPFFIPWKFLAGESCSLKNLRLCDSQVDFTDFSLSKTSFLISSSQRKAFLPNLKRLYVTDSYAPGNFQKLLKAIGAKKLHVFILPSTKPINKKNEEEKVKEGKEYVSSLRREHEDSDSDKNSGDDTECLSQLLETDLSNNETKNTGNDKTAAKKNLGETSSSKRDTPATYKDSRPLLLRHFSLEKSSLISKDPVVTLFNIAMDSTNVKTVNFDNCGRTCSFTDTAGTSKSFGDLKFPKKFALTVKKIPSLKRKRVGTSLDELPLVETRELKRYKTEHTQRIEGDPFGSLDDIFDKPSLSELCPISYSYTPPFVAGSKINALEQMFSVDQPKKRKYTKRKVK